VKHVSFNGGKSEGLVDGENGDRHV